MPCVRVVHTLKRGELHYMSVIKHISFSPDGKYFLALCDDGMTYMSIKEDSKNGVPIVEELYHYHSDTDLSSASAFSVNGEHLAICDYNATILIFETATFTIIKQIKCPIISTFKNSQSSQVFYSTNGKYLIHGASYEDVQIYDAMTFELLHTLPMAKYRLQYISLATCADKLVVAGYSIYVRIYDINTLALLHTIYKPCRTPIPKIAFSPDGKYFTDKTPYDRYVKIYDAITFQEVALIQAIDMYKLLFSRNGKYFGMIMDSGDIKLYDVKTFEMLHCFKSSLYAYCSFTFSMDEHWLVVGHGHEFSPGAIQFFNLTTFKMEFEFLTSRKRRRWHNKLE